MYNFFDVEQRKFICISYYLIRKILLYKSYVRKFMLTIFYAKFVHLQL
jgi:hypothetical protein